MIPLFGNHGEVLANYFYWVVKTIQVKTTQAEFATNYIPSP